MPDRENREKERVPFETEVQVENSGEFVEKFAGNISRGGMFVKTPRPLDVGREVVLKVALAGGGYLEVEGIVAWTRTDEDTKTSEPPGMGIRFKQLGAGIEVLVDRIVTAGEARASTDGMIRLLVMQLRRNKKGETVREGRIIEGETIAIGRASDKHIHLADPRVALSHAVIRQRSFGTLVLESSGPDLRINGTFAQNADLGIGMVVEIGSFRMVVEANAGAGYPPHDLVLSIERVLPAADESAARKHTLAKSLATTRLGIRRPALLLGALLGLPFLVLPVLNVASPGAAAKLKEVGVNPAIAWSAGPVSSSHRSIEGDCAACHAKPFAAVQDKECLGCHATTGEHIGDPALRLAVTGGARCAECHSEHRGERSLASGDPRLCVDCHGTLGTEHPEAGLENITGFTSGHPAFRLSMVSETSGRVTLARISQEDERSRTWDGGLRFTHAVHLSKDGVRSPLAVAGELGKVVMQCADCHKLESSRHFYEPVNMERHCAGCHRLDFEPGRTSRQVPHGSVAGVITTLREFYAGVALGTTPIVKTESATSMVRPGENRREPGSSILATQQWVNDAAERAAFEIFEKRACHDCHQIDRVATAANDPAGFRGTTWRVRRVIQAGRSFPNNEFEHSRHDSVACTQCHPAATSAAATDVLIPTITTCRECHASETQPEKVTSGCESCHEFHAHTSGSRAEAVP